MGHPDSLLGLDESVKIILLNQIQSADLSALFKAVTVTNLFT